MPLPKWIKGNFTPIKLTIGASILVAVVPIIYTVWRDQYPHGGHVFNISGEWASYGSWLQGSLTPILLVFTIVTFLSQSQDTQEQIKEQRDANNEQRNANRLTGQMLFLSTLDSYVEHLDSLCYAAQDGTVRQSVSTKSENPRGAMRDLTNVLTGKAKHSHARTYAFSDNLTSIRSTRYYQQLERDTLSLFQRGKEIGLDHRIDLMVADLAEGIKKNPAR